MTITAHGPSVRGVMDEREGTEPRYVDSAGAARILGLAPVTVRRAAKAGRLPAVRIGGEWRFSVEDLRTLPRYRSPDEPPAPD